MYKFPTRGGGGLLAVDGLDGQFTYRFMCTECLNAVLGLSAVTNDKLTFCMVQAHTKKGSK